MQGASLVALALAELESCRTGAASTWAVARRVTDAITAEVDQGASLHGLTLKDDKSWSSGDAITAWPWWCLRKLIHDSGLLDGEDMAWATQDVQLGASRTASATMPIGFHSAS